MFVSPCGLVTFSLKSEEWNSRSCNTPTEQTYEGIWLTWEPAGSSKLAGFILEAPFPFFLVFFFFFLLSSQLNLSFYFTSCSVLLSTEFSKPGVLEGPDLPVGEGVRLFPGVAGWETRVRCDAASLEPAPESGTALKCLQAVTRPLHTRAQVDSDLLPTWVVSGKVYSLQHKPGAASDFGS